MSDFPIDSVIICPNCDSPLPVGCGGTFKDSDDGHCWLNRPDKMEAAEKAELLTGEEECLTTTTS